MARNSGKALDDVLDWANEFKGKITMVKTRLEMFREATLTAGEKAIVDAIDLLLKDDEGE